MLHKISIWIIVFIWMAVIFYLSHQPASASSELSTGITELFVNFLKQFLPIIQDEIKGLTFIVRKLAHLFAYFVLGFLMIRAIRVSAGKLNFFVTCIAFFICVLYAISDEVHQLYIPGRSGEVRDVLIDSFGAFMGIGFYVISSKLLKKTSR